MVSQIEMTGSEVVSSTFVGHLVGRDRVARTRLDLATRFNAWQGYMSEEAARVQATYADAVALLSPADRLKAPWYLDRLICSSYTPKPASFALEHRVGKLREARVLVKDAQPGLQLGFGWTFMPFSGHLELVRPIDMPFLTVSLFVRMTIPHFRRLDV